MKDKLKQLQEFDAKARQTKILNRLTELSQDERVRIDAQVQARAMRPYIKHQDITLGEKLMLTAIGFLFALDIILLVSFFNRPVKVNTQPQRAPIYHRQIVNTPTPTPTQDPRKRTWWVGKVSHYSRAGCLGCSETLTMANGQPLDDNAMTIAFNWLPLNTQVRLTNLDNGKSVIATVTDTGGFNSLNRIADLVPAVANELGTKTDVTNVLIEQL